MKRQESQLPPVADKNDLYNLKRTTRVVECICPNCGCAHKRKIFYTGRGLPRKFCVSCEDLADSIGMEFASPSLSAATRVRSVL
jgi:hypothetical protein